MMVIAVSGSGASPVWKSSPGSTCPSVEGSVRTEYSSVNVMPSDAMNAVTVADMSLSTMPEATATSVTSR